MRYVLATLSHGDPRSPHLEDTLASFEEHVTPTPTAVAQLHDGPGNIIAPTYVGGDHRCVVGGEARGFCRATEALWQLALGAANEHQTDYVFWLEHDFRFLRPVNLDELASVLYHVPRLAQTSLLRQPVNRAERRAGGVLKALEARGHEFGRHLEEGNSGVTKYLTHRAYFTTNPSLMPVGFMRAYPFAAGGSEGECEGRYGLSVIAEGLGFAVWGDGTPWVEHVGQRNGKGY